MNIVVLGWYDHENRGDESYKVAFPLLFPQHTFKFVDSFTGIDLSTIDHIILGGGDIVKRDFTDQLKEIDLPKTAMSVTITPESDLTNLNIFDRVFVRDFRSLAIAQRHIEKDRIAYLPDLAFALTPNPHNGRKLIENRLGNVTEKFICVALNSYTSYNGPNSLAKDHADFMKLVDRLAFLCENMDISWVFLPFSTRLPWDDRPIGGWVANRCQNKYYKNLVIYDKLSVQNTLDIIAASSAVISMRLHSSIFSTLSGTPFVDILHHDKNLGFMETLGLLNRTTSVKEYDSSKVAKLLGEFLSMDGKDGYLEDFTLSAKRQLGEISHILR